MTKDVITYMFGNPQMERRVYKVVRRSDEKVLGTSVQYGRGGGEPPGPWHGSSFTCPDYNKAGINTLLKAIFLSKN